MITSYKDKKLVEYIKPGGRYLIRFGHGLGDTIMFMPAFYRLQQLYPESQIDIYLECGQEEIFVSGMVANGFKKDKAEGLFQSLVDFSSYSFNKCLTGDTKVISDNKHPISIEEIRQRLKAGENVKLKSYNGEELISNECQEVIDCGIQRVFKFHLSDGSEIIATPDHKFICEEDGQYHTLRDIIDMDLTIKKTEGYHRWQTISQQQTKE